MTAVDALLAKSRDLARRISLDVDDMVCHRMPFDAQQMENELTEALVVFAHEAAEAEKGESELVAALQECAESLALARERLGMRGEGDGQDRKADKPDDIGSLGALLNARAILSKHATPATQKD